MTDSNVNTQTLDASWARDATTAEKVPELEFAAVQLRNPRLRFESIVREESRGIAVDRLAWTRKRCGEFGWG